MTEPDTCPGTCNRAWRRQQLAGVPDNQEPLEAWPGEPVWCRTCQDAIRSALGRLPDHAAAVLAHHDGTLPAVRSSDNGPRAKHPDPPSPSPAWDTADDVLAWAWAWCEVLATHLSDPTGAPVHPVTGLPVLELTRSVRYLQGHLTPALSAPFAVELGQEALDKDRELERAAGMDRLVHRLPVPCLTCDRRSLVRADGSDVVRCGACRREWAWDQVERLVAEYGRGVRMGAGA